MSNSRRRFRRREQARTTPRATGGATELGLSVAEVLTVAKPLFETILLRFRELPARVHDLSSDSRAAVAAEIERIIAEFDTL